MVVKVFLRIGVLIVIAVLILVIWRVRYEQKVSQIWRSLQSQPARPHFTEDMIAALPAPVQRYFLHSIAPGTPLASSVQLKMSGNFRLGQDKPWLPMQATEIISTKGFVWKATIGHGWLLMKGADYYANGVGRVRFALWGLLPLVDAHSPDTHRSSLGRLAGEWIWLPSALLPQQGVYWEAVDERTIQASLKIDGEPVTLTLVIDANGKLLKFSLPRWGNQTDDGSHTYIPFGGEVQAEQRFDGLTIPTQVNLGWGFGTERYFEFFRAQIVEAKFN